MPQMPVNDINYNVLMEKLMSVNKEVFVYLN